METQSLEGEDARLRIAIFGSCVSRDSCEFMPDASVEAYVARQSAIVSLNPVGEGFHSSQLLDSAFQAKMFEGDQKADAVQRLADADPDLILLDLVDERRGVWKFSDGEYLTNSVEAYRTGIEEWAPVRGARLVEFGTDEHYELWKAGFSHSMKSLMALRKPIVFLDIAWAEVFDGQELPRGLRSSAGLVLRRAQRRYRNLSRALDRGEPVVDAVRSMTAPGRTRSETLIAQAQEANELYKRYSDFARRYAHHTVHRSVGDVRIGTDHRWGPEPFHYRDDDYLGIVEEIAQRFTSVYWESRR
jgi:hypothetical protein